jgi:hypothetical protein
MNVNLHDCDVDIMYWSYNGVVFPSHYTTVLCSNVIHFKFLKLRPQLFTHVNYFTALENVDVFKLFDTKSMTYS